MLQLNNNQYVALADKEDNEGKDNESTGVQNDGEITGVRHNDKIIGVNSDNETPELVSMEANYKADELALIQEAITESEQDITEGTDILAGTETETEEAQNENVIHLTLQVPTVEHTYNLR